MRRSPLTCLRFGLGALLLLGVLIWRGDVRTVPIAPRLAAAGRAGPARRDGVRCALHVGLQWTGAAEGTLIQGMSPLLTLLLAALLVGEPIRRGQVLGGLTAFAGLVVLLLGGTAAWGGGDDRLLGNFVLCRRLPLLDRLQRGRAADGRPPAARRVERLRAAGRDGRC